MRSIHPTGIFIAYALVWFFIIFAILTIPLVIFGQVVEGWQELLFFGLVVAVWVYVLWRRVPLDWLGSLKWPVLALVFLSFAQSFALSLIGYIAIGKLLIAGWGRWSLFGGSRLKCPELAISPRGLVEPRSYED